MIISTKNDRIDFDRTLSIESPSSRVGLDVTIRIPCHCVRKEAILASVRDSPARECPSFRCACYRDKCQIWQRIWNPFSLNTRQSETETRPQPSARAKWLGEPVDTPGPSREPATRACARRVRRDRVVSSHRASPRKNHSHLWLSKNSFDLLTDENQGIFGDIRSIGFISVYLALFGQSSSRRCRTVAREDNRVLKSKVNYSSRVIFINTILGNRI